MQLNTSFAQAALFRSAIADRRDEHLPHAPQYYFDWQLPIDYAARLDCPHICSWLVQMRSPGGANVVRAFARAVLTGQDPTNGLHRYLELV